MMAANLAQAQTRSFDVPSDAAVRSIPQFSRQAGLQIMAPADGLSSVVTPAIRGERDVRAALRELLARTPRDGESESLAARLATLSPQQLKVLQRVAEGRLNKQIADELGIQERTVKAHLTVVFEKLGVRNRTQAGVLLSGLAGE